MLNTAQEIFDKLGGISAVAAIAGVKYNRASNWKQFGRFPPNTFIIINKELEARGLKADAALWGMIVTPADAAE